MSMTAVASSSVMRAMVTESVISVSRPPAADRSRMYGRVPGHDGGEADDQPDALSEHEADNVCRRDTCERVGERPTDRDRRVRERRRRREPVGGGYVRTYRARDDA